MDDLLKVQKIREQKKIKKVKLKTDVRDEEAKEKDV